ncbi:MAG: hypothetical protein PVF56_20125 [Desulfobacterales bacterium]|jgi:hypothetical protein
MQTQLDIYCSKDSDRDFAEQIRLWAEELMDSLTGEALPERVSIRLYHLIDELRTFFQQEKKALGVVSQGEEEFIATHEAWRGYPRIHLCCERIKDLCETVVLGAVQHELAHAMLHGKPEFYTFRFSRHLITAGTTVGLDMQLLQQFAYLLSIALKDAEVVRKLADIGFESGQIALIEHMIADTQAERSVWDAIQNLPPQRKIAIALFMKILLPLKTLAHIRAEAGDRLQRLWEKNYGWIKEEERWQMSRFAAETANRRERPFQHWLEQTAIDLITDRRL